MSFILEGSNNRERDSCDETRIPAALASAAEQLDLSYVVTVSLLNGQASLIARRSSEAHAEWSTEMWVAFYQKVKEFI